MGCQVGRSSKKTRKPACKIQLTTAWEEPLSTERFLELSTSFMDSMIPEIARCLPDWVDVSADTDTQ